MRNLDFPFYILTHKQTATNPPFRIHTNGNDPFQLRSPGAFFPGRVYQLPVGNNGLASAVYIKNLDI